MRNTVTLSLLALAGLAVAACDTASPCQPSADAVPVCATPCIKSAAVTQARCSTADYRCQCDKMAIIQAAAVGCVIGGCGFGGALDVLTSVGALCSCVTAHPTIPCTALAAAVSADHVTDHVTKPAPTTTSPATITEPPQVTSTTGPITKGPPPSSCDSVSPCQPSADAVPNCAKPCIESAAVSQASCSTADYQCQCDKQDVIQGAAVGCVIGGCGFETALQVLGSVSALCGCVTAHPTTPCTLAPATSTAAPITTTEEPPETTASSYSTSSSVSASTSTSATGPITTGPTTCDSASPCQPSADAVPKCAQSCISSAAEGVHCAAADFACQCSKAGDIQNGAANCVIGGCGFDTALQVITAVGSLCDCVTAHPTTPCASVPATATSPGTTEKPATTTASSHTGPITSSPSSCGATSPCQSSAEAVPGCAKPCIESAAVTQASCVMADYQCQCSKQDVIQGAAAGCVVGGCGFDTALQVLGSVGALCDCVTAHPTPSCTSSHATSTSAPQTSNKSEVSSSQAGTTTKPNTGSEPSTTSKDCSTTGPVGSQTVTSNRATVTSSEQGPSPSSTSEEGSGSLSSPSTKTGRTDTGGPTHTDGNGTGSPTTTGQPTGQPTRGSGGQPTGGNGQSTGGGSSGGNGPSSSGSSQPTGGNGGIPGGSCEIVTISHDGNVQTSTTCYDTNEPTGGNGGGNGGGSGGEPTGPPVVAPAARFETSLVAAAVFGGVFWMIAVVAL